MTACRYTYERKARSTRCMGRASTARELR